MAHVINHSEELNEDSHETLSDEILIVIMLLVLASWLNARLADTFMITRGKVKLSVISD